MLNALIIDDEPNSRETLKALLKRSCPEVQVCGEANGVERAQVLINAQKPDLIFLDISMPGGDGFELLSRVKKPDFEIIFVTGYDQYALQAIKSCALDYLLKPVQIQELKAAVARAQEVSKLKNTKQQLQHLLANLKRKDTTEQNLAIPNPTGLSFVSTKDIVRLEADGSYTTVYTTNGQSLVSTWHLKAYEELLPQEQFFRAHHSHLIHLRQISQYHKGNGGYVVMTDGSSVSISKRRKRDFLQLFELPGISQL